MAAEKYFDDLQVGDTLHTLDKGTMTTSHIMRWSAAIENWHRIHYDQPFATGHDGLPGILINGSWKQHVLVQVVKDGLGPGGWLWKIRFRYKSMDLAGDALSVHAEVIEKQEVDGLGCVTLGINMTNQRGEVSTAGHAIGLMPLRGGRPVPYPFEPEASFQGVRLPDA
jgi:acyl dehydratase